MYDFYYEKLSTKTHNPHYLKRYIKFIIACSDYNVSFSVTERHHICPSNKHFFPEFKSFKKYPWNLIRLTPRQHYIAHHILARCFGSGMWYAFNMMCNKTIETRTYRVSSRVYSELKANLAEQISCREISDETRKKMSDKAKHRDLSTNVDKMHKRVSGSVWMKHVDLQVSKRVSKEDIDSHLNSGWELGRLYRATPELKEKLSKDRKGKIIGPFTDEHKKNIGESVKGKVPVFDTETGKQFRCSVDDPKYLNGTYIHVAKHYHQSLKNAESLTSALP